MIERDHPDLSIGQQCALLQVPRSSFYYAPQGETEKNLALMRLIDLRPADLDTPFFGVQQMTWHLRNDGHAVNEKRIRRLMRLMGVRQENGPPDCLLFFLTTDLPETQHQQGDERAQDLPLSAARAACGQAKPGPPLGIMLRMTLPGSGCVDITYLPMRRGFHYLVAIMDWHTRMVLSWRISNTLDAGFCVEALNEANYRFGPPDIMNSPSHGLQANHCRAVDQGSQFTSFAWTDRLRRSGIRISMDGKGRYLDNIFIERLWRTLKYECVYLHAWDTGSQARAGIRNWMEFYNHSRPHKALGGRPPAVIYSLQIEATQPNQQEQIRA